MAKATRLARLTGLSLKCGGNLLQGGKTRTSATMCWVRWQALEVLEFLSITNEENSGSAKTLQTFMGLKWAL